MDEPIDRATLAERTTEIVAAFVAHNQLPPTEVGSLIGLVANRLASLGAEATQVAPAKPEPVVPVRRSVSPDRIICLVCGKAQKLLKRHLAVAHELTPAQYRERFGLKRDYPMVAPSYARARSEAALRIGLGRPKKEPRPAKRAGAKPSTAKRTRRAKAAAE
ncbi:MAG TPA: MucR family transcriptional regulator [Geminicoccaceae bacterium]|nr:MucR family transcriptional regulator [Geminicoccaceae bacterium]